MDTDDSGVKRDLWGIPVGGLHSQKDKYFAGANQYDSPASADLKAESQKLHNQRMKDLVVVTTPWSINWWVLGGIAVVGLLVFALASAYFGMSAGAAQPVERLRLVSWAVHGARDEWSLSNGWQLVAPGESLPPSAAMAPAALSQKLLDQTAWDIIGANPTSEAAKMTLRAAAFECLARDYSACLKAVGDAAETTENNSREFAKRRSKGAPIRPRDLNALDNFLGAAEVFLERKAFNGPTMAQAVSLKASLCLRGIPFNPGQTLESCRNRMRAYLRRPETRGVAQHKLDAMTGWRWSWLSARLDAAVPGN